MKYRVVALGMSRHYELGDFEAETAEQAIDAAKNAYGYLLASLEVEAYAKKD